MNTKKLTPDEIEFKKRISKEAYEKFIGSNVNLNKETLAKANAFCLKAMADRRDLEKNLN